MPVPWIETGPPPRMLPVRPTPFGRRTSTADAGDVAADQADDVAEDAVLALQLAGGGGGGGLVLDDAGTGDVGNVALIVITNGGSPGFQLPMLAKRERLVVGRHCADLTVGTSAADEVIFGGFDGLSAFSTRRTSVTLTLVRSHGNGLDRIRISSGP